MDPAHDHDHDPTSDYGPRLKRMRYQRSMLPVELGRAVRRALDLLPDDEAAHEFVVYLEQTGCVRGTETYSRQVGHAIRHALGVSPETLEDPPRQQSMVRSVMRPTPPGRTVTSRPPPPPSRTRSAAAPPPRPSISQRPSASPPPRHQIVVTLSASEYARLRSVGRGEDPRLTSRELLLEALARREA